MRCAGLGVVVLVAVLTPACGRPSDPSDSDSEWESSPHSPKQGRSPAVDAGPRTTVDLDGRELVVELTVERDRFMVSEPTYAELRFLGDPGVEIEMAWLGRNSLGRPSNYAVAFVGPDGPLPVPDAGPESGGPSWKSAVGSKPATQRLFLPHWVDRLEPGSYTLTVATRVQARPSTSADWRPVSLDLAIPVEVIADDDAQLGALIDRIAADTLTTDDWERSQAAIQRLAAIDDPRTLAAWLALVTFPDYERRFAALEALTALDDPQAFAAVVRATQTQAAELPADRYTTEALRVESAAQLRIVAVQALSRSDAPEAIAAILALETDPHPAVRLLVCQRAGTLDQLRTLPQLWRMAKDPDDLVRAEALRFLAPWGLP